MAATREIKSISIIGAGNLGRNLAFTFYHSGYKIIQIISDKGFSARDTAQPYNAVSSAFGDPLLKADLYFICVNDQNISKVVDKYSFEDHIAVHTSGSVPLEVLSEKNVKTGVFYPLQTFNKAIMADFNKIPICIEASGFEVQQILVDLALTISTDVRIINSTERRSIHLAAVFSCNFTNFMYTAAEDILKKNGLPFDLLIPLIQETTRKILTNYPGNVQTGPAVRKDSVTMDKHLELLDVFPGYKAIYKLISDIIIQYHHTSK